MCVYFFQSDIRIKKSGICVTIMEFRSLSISYLEDRRTYEKCVLYVQRVSPFPSVTFAADFTLSDRYSSGCVY